MQYDIVVIGAGIQGVGVAQAAAAAGYSVLVLEQSGIAAGTSSKSSKLIHGGLRYLETGQLGLVRESLRERALLLKLAPELVKLRHLHIPIYRTSSRSAFTIAAGLSLYKLLSGMSEDTRFRRLRRSEWQSLDGLKTEGLQQVFRYAEAQTDDAGLTEAVMHSAQQLGAELQMPARFEAAVIGDDGCRASGGRVDPPP
jgi:glycerol-3-phosphate dehydrogenase